MKVWNPSVELSPSEESVLKLCKKQKLWAFLRKHRHVLLDEEIRNELATLYDDSPGGRPPEPPERLALAMLLQAAFDVADHEVPTLTAVDRRWQMVLDCLGADSPAFSQGTVFNFRERARNSGFMRHWLDKTITIARETKGFSHKRLRALFDSSPLTGAGRVEDTFNLLGRAIVQVVQVAAVVRGRSPDEVAQELDLPIVTSSSIKAALDVDWRQPEARSEALNDLIAQFRRVEEWLSSVFDEGALASPPLSEPIDTVRRIVEQDTEPEPDPQPPGPPSPHSKRRIRQTDTQRGGRQDRLISVTDRDMRHGRKSKSKGFSGYKRHVAIDGDVPGLICAVEVQPANCREYAAAGPLLEQLAERQLEVVELHIDRGYLPAPEIVRLHEIGLKIVTKPPTPRSSERFGKNDFNLDFEARTATCPAEVTVPIKPDRTTICFPAAKCRNCHLRDDCVAPKQKGGRDLRLHSHEQWYREMAADLATPEGRAARRERVQVEHALARVGMIQGTRARYRGLQKNQFDLERTAVVANCYALCQLLDHAA